MVAWTATPPRWDANPWRTYGKCRLYNIWVLSENESEKHAKLVSSSYGSHSKSFSEDSAGAEISDHDAAGDHVVVDLLQHGRHNGLVARLCRCPFDPIGYRDLRHRNGI